MSGPPSNYDEHGKQPALVAHVVHPVVPPGVAPGQRMRVQVATAMEEAQPLQARGVPSDRTSYRRAMASG